MSDALSDKNYDVVIYDPSIFFTHINQSLQDVLLNLGKKKYASLHFDFTIEQLIKLGYNAKDSFDRNIDFYSSLKNRLDKPVFAISSRTEIPFLTMLEMISQKMDAKHFVLCTANQIQVEYAVFAKINIDIIFISKEKSEGYELLCRGQFEDLAIKFSSEKKINPYNYYKLKEGDVVYGQNNKKITLGNPLTESGFEAEIFKCDIINEVAKIFRGDKDGKSKLTENKLSVINKLIESNWNFPWLVRPVEILYMDEENLCPVGYLMEYISGITRLKSGTIFNGDLDTLAEPIHNKRTPKYVAKICTDFCRQVLWLNINGFLVGDYNDGNFGIAPDKDNPTLYMFDTDSFSWKNNLTQVEANDIDYPNNRKYVNSVGTENTAAINKFYIIQKDFDSLFILNFELVTLMEHPFVYGNAKDLSLIESDDSIAQETKARLSLISKFIRKIYDGISQNNLIYSSEELLFHFAKHLDTVGGYVPYSEQERFVDIVFPQRKLNPIPKPPPIPDSLPILEEVFTKIIFDVNGGKLSPSQRFQKRKIGEKYKTSNLPKPKRKLYVFDGWYTELGDKVDSDTRVQKNQKLRAHWKPSAVLITIWVLLLVLLCLVLYFAVTYVQNNNYLMNENQLSTSYNIKICSDGDYESKFLINGKEKYFYMNDDI